MKKTPRKTYSKPVVTRVRFADKALVSFKQCRKVTDLTNDECIIPESNGQPAYVPDPS